MNRSDEQARPYTPDRLNAALNEVGGSARPGYLDEIVARAHHTRQRPAWTFLERWLPMSIAMRREGIPRVAILFALLLLLLVLIAGVVALSGSPTRPPAPIVVTNGLITFESGGDIVSIQPDGTERRVLVRGTGEQGSLAFSPDGRRIAYWSQSGPLWDLVVADADGSRPLTIATGVIEATGDGHPPDWSPDGKRIAFSARTEPSGTSSSCPGSGSQNGEFCSARIFVAAADGSGAHQIGDPALDARSPAWSPDGSTIAFGGGNASPAIGVRLYFMNPDGTNVRSVSDVRGTDWAFVQNDWSRDGSKITAQANAANDLAEWEIWVIKADGSGATDVGDHGGGDEIFPGWAPDRDALAWRGAGGEIVLLENGGKSVDLPPPGGAPVWSPDGKLLTTVTDQGALVVTDLRGAVRLTIAGASGFPSWQPLFSER